MPDNLPAHGRHKDTARDVQRTTIGRGQDWFFPTRASGERPDRPGTLICPTCHAISTQKRWFLDEALYEHLRTRSEVEAIQCPGCERIERGTYEGRVVLSGSYLAEHKTEIVNLIKNQEAEARQTNPFSRVGALKDSGDQIELYVTTQWLAERIGKEVRKAQRGELKIDHLPREKFLLVTWRRDKAA